MSDLWIMIWKEVKDEVLQGGRQAWIRPLLIIAIMGIILPWELGLGWLAFNNVVILVVVYISFFFISSFIGDAIAGEHERHTLETLLASRISDRAILLGKVIVTVGYTWLLVLVSLMIGALVVNVTKGPGPWTFYAPFSLLIYTLVLSFYPVSWWRVAAYWYRFIPLRSDRRNKPWRSPPLCLQCCWCLGSDPFRRI